MWAIAAPAFAASMAAVAISSGDFGRSGCLPAVSPEPVTAHVIIGLRFNDSSLCERRNDEVRVGCRARALHTLRVVGHHNAAVPAHRDHAGVATQPRNLIEHLLRGVFHWSARLV